MSLENPTEKILIATEKKDENESQKSMSDGEIEDDDDVEDVKPNLNPINIPLRKLQKNFRARQSDSDDDEEEEGAIVERKTDKSSDDSKKMNARLVNGDEKYLQSVRKKIINELNEKDDGRRNDRYFNDRRNSGNFYQNRFNNNRFRPPPNDSFRRNNNHNSRPSLNERRENGKREIPLDVLEVRGRYRLLYFPKNIIKQTNTTPSISYAENPQSHHLKEDRKEKRNEKDKKKDKFSKDKRRSRSRKRNESKKRTKDSSKSKDETPKQEKPDINEKSPQKKEEIIIEKSSNDVEVKLTEENTEERTPELPPIEIDEMKKENEPECEIEEEQQEEKLKFEPIIIERKTIRKIERPKVNIFLEDSDEVDEFENANVITTLEVKSKWSSPEPEKIVEEDNDNNMIEIVPKSIENKFKEKITEIPEVVESPEKSPVTPMTESIFESSSISMSMSKSPTPMNSGKPVKNVCSFLSDIESEGYLSGFSLGSGLYSDDEDDDSKLTDNLELNTGSLFNKNPEPDTTIEDKEKKESNDDDSDSDESESSSSSESSSDSSSSSESEDESSDSSDDETTAIVSRFGGFGRFDATSIPMVTQIKPVLTQTIAGTASSETTVVQSRFQPHQSIIRPPQLVTNLTRPSLYPATPVIATPTTPMPFASPFGAGQFPVPFKIYSLKDAGNTGIIFPSSTPVTPIATPSSSSISVATVEKEKEKEKIKETEKEKDREREKRSEKRERERHRSRSYSRDRDRDRDRKRHKDDRRDSERRKTPPPKRRSPSPIKNRKHIDDKRDIKRRDSSPRHNSSHSSRSISRRSRRSRSRSPIRSSINLRPRTPPSRPRTPPPKLRRISPRRSHSRSPPAKHRRSSSPAHRNHHHSRLSPSPIYNKRNSPRRRYSPSPPIKDQTHLRRTPSRTPDDYDRFDRHSYSPSFRGKIDSPNGYKQPDSTISDTELERQQQFAAQNDYYSWNSSISQQHSPRRQNLDERIHRMLSDSPTSASVQQQQQMYAPDGSFSYQQIHDNHFPPPSSHNNYHQSLYYPDIYSENQSSFMPPSSIDSRYDHTHNNSFDDGFNAFPSPRYVNNSNLVEITQQKRERQRAGSNQVAVQVGNCLEIVPSSKIPTPPMQENNSMTKSKSLSPEEIKQQSERREQAKLRRKADRERKRMAKFLRKEKLRQEIQKYFDAGINIEDSDDETLIKLRPINVNAIAERGIIKKSNEKEAQAAATEKKEKRVLFTDGVHAGETSSDEENNTESEQTKKLRLKRKKIRKRRLNMLIKERKNASTNNELDILVQKQDQLIEAAPPDPPPNSPPPHLKQPQLKIITADMFAQFAVNHEPMYYHLHKLQAQQQEQQAAAANAYHHMPSRNNSNDRYRYNNKHQQPPPTSLHQQQQQSQYMQQQQRYCIPHKPLNSLDPRINQQRSIEKSFA
ncbi:hypothetical protein PVAND_004112 [Polypedilum vanderplanki]|uniref:Uncharacterized protein n=1 Tax=Polypedilum vanderplanki TaxID=319348 RepID=A0A9J6BW49_POLVA|nr:hypothetical protein PVAND_004112 [Polypedilum vanderplanki]